ncbi:MAG: GntR family transcriptional regulator, partial [Desulfotomaculum sp.]|nr:GntR family transcriptional regulator [Desulfotomaculum sp.]
IQRAYNELERIWIAETKRGLGTFVTEDAGRLKRVREQLKEERIKSFIKRYG